jgi:hypothetical protein
MLEKKQTGIKMGYEGINKRHIDKQ